MVSKNRYRSISEMLGEFRKRNYAAAISAGTNYRMFKEMTTRPGKFQGEKPYVPYFYEIGMNGFANEDDGGWSFDVKPEDVTIFPELRGKRKVKIDVSDNGFVFER